MMISFLCKCKHKDFEHLLGIAECLACDCKKFEENNDNSR